MNMFQHIAKTTTVGVVTVLFAASFAAAEEGGRHRVPPTAGATALQPGVAAKPATTPVPEARALLQPWPGLHPSP